MLTDFFKAPYRLAHFRGSEAGKYVDDFARHLHEAGYGHGTGRDYIRGAAHLGHWLGARGLEVRRCDEAVLGRFEVHLKRCRCGHLGRELDRDRFGARCFLKYLRFIGVVPPLPDPAPPPRLLEDFRSWMREHRGVTEATLKIYSPIVAEFLRSVGNAPRRVDAASLRGFVLRRVDRRGTPQGQHAVTALRMFVRHLVSREIVPAGLESAIPPVRSWRLSRLPHYLCATDVDRVIAACDRRTAVGIRDRAIILLLARLGLRAGDVASLRLSAIDWQDASICLAGKGRREVRLPLPQDVGGAILAYAGHVRPHVAIDRLFIRQRAPLQPITSGAVTEIARRTLRRAGVSVPVWGAHVLRYSAATAMLRQGLPLQEIGRVLRHRSVDVTAHYAKVDVDLLRSVVQPWPEARPC